MATHDGKSFGKAELEWIYDWMAAHKGEGFEACIKATGERYPDLTVREVTAMVVAMRKERRAMIVTQANVAGIQSMHHWAASVVKSAGAFVYRDELIRTFAEHWGIAEDDASNFIDHAIINLDNPAQRFVVFDDFETIARFRMQEAARDGDTAAALKWAKHVKTTPEELAKQRESYARSLLNDTDSSRTGRPEPFEGVFVDRLDAAAACEPEDAIKAWVPVPDQTARHGERIKGVLSWIIGSLVSKVKGYRFPGEVIAEFKTRKGKVRYVVEGIGDGNDECLHIFSAEDLREIDAPFGWVYSADGYWWHSDRHPDRHDDGTLRPATAAEHQFTRRPAQPAGAGKSAP